MPTAAWLAAAKESPRDMVAVLSIESVDAIKAACTTKADWDAGKSVTNLNSATEPGTVYLVTDGNESYSGEYVAPTIAVNALSPCPTEAQTIALGAPALGVFAAVELETAASATYNNRTVGAVVQFDIAPWANIDQYSIAGQQAQWRAAICDVSWQILGSLSGGAYQVLASGKTNWQAEGTLENVPGSGMGVTYPVVHKSVALELAKGPWSFKIKIIGITPNHYYGWDLPFYTSGANFYYVLSAGFISHTDTHSTQYVTGGSTQTRTIDLGTVPTVPSRLEFDDFAPGGTVLIYTARGSSDGSNWTNLGTVEDGQSVPPYRYYDITATFTASADGMKSPFLHEIRITGGNSQFVRVGTHHDQPVQGVLPYIAGSIGALTSRLELAKVTTGGELSLKLVYNAWVADLIARGGLRNQAVTMLVGFLGLAESDYEPYFVGTAYDYQIDHVQQEVTLRCRDVWKRFKQKIPTETVDASGNKTTTPITWTGANALQVMLDIVDYIDVPDRYINRASFTAIRDGARSGADWQVTRTVTDPTEALQLLGELTEVAGVFLTIGTDGKLTATLYDTAAAPVDIIDARHVRVRKIESGDSALTTRQLVYYQLKAGETGGSAADYDKAYILINADAETAQGEVVEKEYFDKWGMSANAIVALATRRNEWYGQLLHRVHLEEVPPWHTGAATGQVVAVDGLPFPAPAAMWGKLSYRKKFLTMVKTPDPNRGFEAKMELLELIRNATFTRTTTAYGLTGALVKASAPRYESGRGNGGMSIFVEEGTTNLCPANMANASDTAQFGADTGSTLSLEQFFPLFDLVSLKIVNGGGTFGAGGYTGLLTVTGTTVYSGQVVIKGSGQVDVYLRSYLSDGVTIVATSTKTTVTLSSTPQRVRIEGFNTGTDGVRLRLIIRSTTTAAISVVADRFQVEQKPYCTSWYPGTRNGENVSVAPCSSLLTASEFTVEAWVNPLDRTLPSQTRASVLSNWITWNATNQKGFLLSAGFSGYWLPSFIVNNNTATYYTAGASNPIIPGQWTHLAGVFKGGEHITLYVNGVQAARVTAVPSQCVFEGESISIGYSIINNGWFNGRIDDVWFSTKARSARQIADDYRTGLLIPTTGETIHLIDFDNNREIKQVTV